MNKRKRERVGEATTLLRQAENIVENIMDSEQDSMDNMAEFFEGTERYQKLEDAVDNLDSAIKSIGDAINYIEAASD